MRSSGHKVLITGGGTGIGLALARQFQSAGNEVVIVGRRGAVLERAAAVLSGVTPLVADVADPAQRTRLLDECRDVSVLVNNAGVQHNGSFAGMRPEEIEQEIAVNQVAPVMLCHAFLPVLLRRDEAAIVNVSSVLAIVPKESAPVYCATKAALHSFSQALRWQLEGTSVRLFELVPPRVKTAMAEGRSGGGPISPETVAAQFWAAYRADRSEIYVGRARAARIAERLAPRLLRRLVRRA
jgi:uncharacterized oxidoreductase